MSEKIMIGKTIRNIEVDGCIVFIEFTDGYIFSYSASDGGYSSWEIYKNREQYGRNEYKPVCPFHMTDCVCDPAYIQHYYPEWYELLYGNVPPEQAIQEFCAKRADPFECYDDEDK